VQDELGKTTRLINQMTFDKDKYDLQILLGMNHPHIHNIKKQCHNNKIKCVSSFNDLLNVIYANKNLKTKLYVDEFLYSTVFCNNYKELLERFPELIKNGYYTGSINTRYYHDVFNSLQDLNDGNYFSVIKGNQPWM
jgi:hypothetical protein